MDELCIYVRTFTCLWCVHLPVDSICRMMCVWELLKMRPTTNKKVEVVGLLKKIPLNFYSLVCDHKLSLAPYAEWFVSYPLLDCCFHTGFHDGKSRIHNIDYERTASVTGQQRMLTPPWHPILLSLCRRSVIALHSTLYVLFLDCYHVYHFGNFANRYTNIEICLYVRIQTGQLIISVLVIHYYDVVTVIFYFWCIATNMHSTYFCRIRSN
jgi:hypothetical protein